MACHPAATARRRVLWGFPYPARRAAGHHQGRRPPPPLPAHLAYHPAQRPRRGHLRDPVRPHRSYPGEQQPGPGAAGWLAVRCDAHRHAEPDQQREPGGQQGRRQERGTDGAAHRGGSGAEAQQRCCATTHPGAADHSARTGPGAEPGAEHVERIPVRLMTRSGELAGELTFRALGTVVSLIVVDDAARGAAYYILCEELSAVDAACSRFRADSELSRLNQAGGHPIPVSRRFADALAAALTAAQVTDGDVDPTCGGSLAAIGYDRDFAEVRGNTEAL